MKYLFIFLFGVSVFYSFHLLRGVNHDRMELAERFDPERKNKVDELSNSLVKQRLELRAAQDLLQVKDDEIRLSRSHAREEYRSSEALKRGAARENEVNRKLSIKERIARLNQEQGRMRDDVAAAGRAFEKAVETYNKSVREYERKYAQFEQKEQNALNAKITEYKNKRGGYSNSYGVQIQKAEKEFQERLAVQKKAIAAASLKLKKNADELEKKYNDLSVSVAKRDEAIFAQIARLEKAAISGREDVDLVDDVHAHLMEVSESYRDEQNRLEELRTEAAKKITDFEPIIASTEQKLNNLRNDYQRDMNLAQAEIDKRKQNIYVYGGLVGVLLCGLTLLSFSRGRDGY